MEREASVLSRALALPTVLWLLLAAMVLPFASGSESAAPPLLSAGVVDAPGSRSVHFETRGGPVEMDISGSGLGAAGGGLLLDGPLGPLLLTVAKIPSRDGVLVDIRGPAALHVDMTASVSTQTRFGEGIRFEHLPPGAYDLVAFGAGAVDEWQWSLRASGMLVREDAHDDAWLATSRDFAGPSNVQAFQAGAGARATDGRFAFEVERGLVGVYYPVHATSLHDSLMATTPEGPRECTCAWMGPGGEGGYVLHESGVGAGSSLLAEVVFIGADASFA